MNSPTLTENRVASMRSSVMLAVDNDITRRGRRARNTIGLAAASVLVVGFGTFTATQLDTGGGDSDSASSGSAAKRVQTATPGEKAGDTAGGDAVLRDEKSVAPDADRQVITTGEVNVTVKEPRDVAQRLSSYVESISGRVDSRTENGSGDSASAHVTVRVPSTKVTATIDRLKTYGTVEDVSLQNDDVTAQTKDLDARIDALQISIARLEKLLTKADTSAQVIAAENALTQRQEQLESMQAQRQGIADQVSLSTLSINLSQTPRPDSVEPGGFKGGLTDGWNALVSMVNNIVEVAGLLLPWAVLLGLVYGAYRLVTIRRRRPTGRE